MRNLLRWFSLLMALVVIHTVQAQTETATVFGTVRDSSGAVMPGLAVTITNELTGQARTMASGGEGSYAFALLPVGRYSLSAEAAGFKEYLRTGITLQVSQNARLDITMEVGASAETVTVEANAEQLDTLTGTIREVVDAERMVQLPLNGRNPLQLQFLIPGVSGANLTGGRAQNEGVSINGARPNANNYVLDGADYNDPYFNLAPVFPSPDALQEFTVLTNSYSAEYGRNSGGVISAITRSGTNEVHGTLFEFLRNEEFDARPFFATSRAPFRQNQFGGTLGGPLSIPRLYKGRDRTFFLVSYEARRTRSSPSAITSTVPTALERRGNFFGSAAIRDPVTGVAFPLNQIPTERIDTVSRNFLNQFVPLANVGDRLLSLDSSSSTSGDQVVGKVDHSFSDHNRLTGRYIFLNVDQTKSTGNLPGFFSHPNQRNSHLVVKDTHIFGPALLNTVSFTFSRVGQRQSPEAPGNTSWADLGANIISARLKPGPTAYQMGVAGYFTADTGWETFQPRNSYQFADNVAYTWGRHLLKMGGEFRGLYGTGGGNYMTDPSIQFRGQFTGNALADFMLGRPASYAQISPIVSSVHQMGYALYLQDDVRVSRHFTLNLGIRYDPFLPMIENNNKLATFMPGQQSRVYPNAPRGILFPGDAGVPGTVIPKDQNNIGPRIGFAADPTGTGRISLRGGYGIFYDTLQLEPYAGFITNQPFALQLVIPAPPSLSNPFAGRTNPFPFAPPSTPEEFQNYRFTTPVTAASFDLGYHTAYVQQWNFNVQTQLHSNWMLTVAYVGAKGTKLFGWYERNPAIYIPGGSTPANTNQRRMFAPSFGPVKHMASFADSKHHAVQISVNKRLSRGFSILTSYTFGKTLDLLSPGTAYTGVPNPFGFRASKGPSDFDISHRWVASFIWDLPLFSARRDVLHHVLGGWQLNGIVTVRSGLPFSVMSGVDNSFSGVGLDRADLVGDPNLPGGRSRGDLIGRFFNTNAFAANALGTFGTSGRNILRGPGSQNVDLGVMKSFAVREKVRLVLRGESFNIFNQPALWNPTANVTAGTNFGRITGADDPRVIQLSLRMSF